MQRIQKVNFQQSIERLLKSLEDKDFKTLKSFIPEEASIAAIMVDGTVLEDSDEYLEFHKEWFEDGEWRLTHDIVFMEETSELSYVVAESEYFDNDEDGSYSLVLLTTCVMRKVEGRWLLTLFQQTEASSDESE